VGARRGVNVDQELARYCKTLKPTEIYSLVRYENGPVCPKNSLYTTLLEPVVWTFETKEPVALNRFKLRGFKPRSPIEGEGALGF
jgi:hypothetical protein